MSDINRVLWSTQPMLPVDPNAGAQRATQRPAGDTRSDFANALRREQNRVSFSQHAMQRLQTRNLGLTDSDLAKLDDTVAKMAGKGAREALVYMNDVALIVSVPNRTVITAMDGGSARDNIFTNIDSTAIL